MEGPQEFFELTSSHPNIDFPCHFNGYNPNTVGTYTTVRTVEYPSEQSESSQEDGKEAASR